jgi:tripartite-type tricarboxylate transporter receptor subunit TctC
MQRSFAIPVLAVASLVCGGTYAAFPEKPVRIVVGYPSGDTTDLIGRIIAPALGEFLGQPFIVENHPGANTNLASARVAKAKADGQTLLLATTAFAINSSLQSGLTYYPLRDFVPVSRVANVHNVLVVQMSSSTKTVAEFIASIRQNPAKTTFASGGPGSVSHLAAELMKLRAGPLNTLHVPYKGLAPALVELLGGHVHALFLTMPFAYPQIRSGRVRALAVAYTRRAALLPEVPTFLEAGITDVEAPVWSAIVAPAGTPYDTLVRLNLAATNVAGSAVVKDRLAAVGAEAMSDTPDQFSAYLRSEVEKWAKVVKAAGITPE